MDDPRSHYEVLGIERQAGTLQVEKAYRFCLELYGEGALATYSLLDPEEARRVRARVHEAYEVLRDPVRRRAYDQGLEWASVLPAAAPERPAAIPLTTAAAAMAAGSAGPLRDLGGHVLQGAAVTLAEPVNGGALRRFREARGVSLQEIAQRSKVGVRYLEYIEQDRHADLPAPVYLRGFLQEYARAVGLEPRRTAEAYLERVARQG